MDDTGLDTNALLALVKALADAHHSNGRKASSAGDYVKVKPRSFSGKQEDWPLFKMRLQAYLSILGLEGVLEETVDKELAIQDNVRKANAKVMQVMVFTATKLCGYCSGNGDIPCNIHGVALIICQRYP